MSNLVRSMLAASLAELDDRDRDAICDALDPDMTPDDKLRAALSERGLVVMRVRRARRRPPAEPYSVTVWSKCDE